MIRLRIGALLSAAAIVFAACGQAASSSAPSAAPGSAAPESQAPSGSAAAEGTPKDGGTLVVQLPGDIATTDSAFAQDSNTSYVMNQVLEGLVKTPPGDATKAAPALAKSWTLSDDGLTYTFELQEGVKFHDGSDFNAEAVCYNYDRWKNFTGALASPDYSYYPGAVFGYGAKSNMESCTANGTNEVVLKLKAPYSSFLLSQTSVTFGINSPTALKALNADNPDPTKSKYNTGGAGAMIGTGPFKFKEWTPNDHVTIEKNADYWNAAEKAHLDAATFRPIDTTAAALNALETGDIDLASIINPVDIPVITEKSDLQVITRGDSCNLFHLGMNEKHKPFDNVKIRQAVASAVNKQNLIDVFYGGNDNANIAGSWLPTTFPGYKDEGLPTYDPEKAKSLIAESGVPAADLTFDFHYPSNVFRPYMPDPKGIFQALQTDLEAVGFTTTPATKPWKEGYVKEETKGLYAMWLIGWTCDWGTADNFLDTAFFWYDGDTPNPEFAYKNDAMHAKINEGKAQTNADAANKAYEEAQDLIVPDMPTVPLVNSKPVVGAKASVKGFVGAGSLTEYLNSVWLDQ